MGSNFKAYDSNPLVQMNVQVMIADNGDYIAKCNYYDSSCYGSSPQEARRRLKEVIRFIGQTAVETYGMIIDLKELCPPKQWSRSLH